MPAFDDDEDRELAGTAWISRRIIAFSSQDSGSLDGSSDNELDETLRDGEDGDGDGEDDGDVGVDAEGEGDDNDEAASQSGGSQASDTFDVSGEQDSASQQPASTSEGGIKGLPILPTVRQETLSAQTYDIVPTIAAPQSTSINAITATADTRWVFSGGSDGYIRRYSWVDSVNGKLMLTVAQRHPFVDSVVKAGVLMSYWENWDGRSKNASSQTTGGGSLSPVYSLAVQNQGLWLLSGTESGTIRLQSVRHDEGKEIALLQQHTSAVSVLTLSSDERGLLSGSWDKSILDWDLNIGKVRTTFASSAGQISCIEARPISSVPVPVETGEQLVQTGSYSSNNAKESSIPNGIQESAPAQPLQDEPQPGATPDSLFGGDEGDDDLFGDSGSVMPSGDPLTGTFGDDEVMPPDLASSPRPAETSDVTMQDQPDLSASQAEQGQEKDAIALQDAEAPGPEKPPGGEFNQKMVNGAPYNAEIENQLPGGKQLEQSELPPTSDSTFLATSIDGTIRIWDRRQPDPVARIQPRNTPPWCLSACWSPDGNNIYAGRRNGTVEEFDLRKGFRGPDRVFKFPTGSGAVTAVKAMPNNRHLIWCVCRYESRSN